MKSNAQDIFNRSIDRKRELSTHDLCSCRCEFDCFLIVVNVFFHRRPIKTTVPPKRRKQCSSDACLWRRSGATSRRRRRRRLRRAHRSPSVWERLNSDRLTTNKYKKIHAWDIQFIDTEGLEMRLNVLVNCTRNAMQLHTTTKIDRITIATVAPTGFKTCVLFFVFVFVFFLFFLKKKRNTVSDNNHKARVSLQPDSRCRCRRHPANSICVDTARRQPREQTD